MTDYLASSAVWSLAGLVVGYVIGKTEVTLLKRRDSHRDDDPDSRA